MTEKFVMTEEQMKEILEGAQEEISIALVEEAKVSVAREFRYKLDGEIAAITKKFIADEIAPELRAHLVANKSDILEAALGSSTEIALAIHNSLTETLVKNLSNSYSRKKIWEALFD